MADSDDRALWDQAGPYKVMRNHEYGTLWIKGHLARRPLLHVLILADRASPAESVGVDMSEVKVRYEWGRWTPTAPPPDSLEEWPANSLNWWWHPCEPHARGACECTIVTPLGGA